MTRTSSATWQANRLRLVCVLTLRRLAARDRVLPELPQPLDASFGSLHAEAFRDLDREARTHQLVRAAVAEYGIDQIAVDDVRRALGRVVLGLPSPDLRDADKGVLEVGEPAQARERGEPKIGPRLRLDVHASGHAYASRPRVA